MVRLTQTFLLLAALLYAMPAWGIPLRAGTLAFDNLLSGNGPVHLKGKRGFVFDGFAFLAHLHIADCVFGCDPRERVSLGLRVNGNDSPGTALFEDVEYTDVGNLLGSNQLDIEVEGFARVPRLTEATERTTSKLARITVRFTHDEPVPLLPTVEEFKGRVLATVVWLQIDDPFFEGQWVADSITYDVIGR